MHKLIINFTSPPLIGGYSGSRFGVDKTTAREFDGVPIIPASAIKGALREAFEYVVPAIPREKRKAQLNYTICDPNEKQVQSETCNCLACQIFGSVEKKEHEGKLKIYDGILAEGDLRNIFEDLENPHSHFGYQTRYGVSISRKLKTALAERLFTGETLDPAIFPLIFESRLEGLEQLDEDHQKLFRLACENVFAIGGGRSRGYGFCNLSITEEETKNTASQEFDYQIQNGETSVNFLIKTQSAICLSDTKDYGSFFPTKDYIPGSTLRGATAAYFLNSHRGPESPEFKKLFLDEGKLCFSNAYPAVLANPKELVLKSAYTCKTNPGFKNETRKKAKKNHGVIDLALKNIIRTKAYEAGFALVMKQACQYEDCTEDLQPCPQIYFLPDSDGSGDQDKVYTRVVTRTALNRKLRTTHESKLFSLETIPAPATFWGQIKGIGEDTIDLVNELNHQIFYIGADKSSGLGKVSLTLYPNEPVAPIEQRLFEFNNRLQQMFQQLQTRFTHLKADVWKNRIYFSIDLFADTIVTDPATNQPLAALPPIDSENGKFKEFYQEIFDGLSIKLINSYSSSHLVSGWNFKHHQPKEVRLAIEKGSVFVFEIEVTNLKINSDAQEFDFQEKSKFLTVLENLENNGLGERHEEGFGWLRVCDPFHYKEEVY